MSVCVNVECVNVHLHGVKCMVHGSSMVCVWCGVVCGVCCVSLPLLLPLFPPSLFHSLFSTRLPPPSVPLSPSSSITGTGKTLLAHAIAKQLDANFLKVVSSAIVDKYIGESARLIWEMFGKLVCFVWDNLLHITLHISVFS